MDFANPDGVQTNSYHTTLLDIPSNSDANDAYSSLNQSRDHLYNSKTSKDLSVHEPALSTLTMYYFVPLGIRTACNNMVFRQCHNFTTREQEEQTPSSIEAHLSCTEAHLKTMETQVSTILDIL
ncbi:hypothetical protein J1N35_025884 [Gossypium stocksii]|uniref:Uncharacterized protein n=1 Tax=Gossypium stocksii TaxID=47602 RepID=A0A9D3V733_9ROSI|nr:hypothetical protein J1N35_025884 [Gossypium stocksii]